MPGSSVLIISLLALGLAICAVGWIRSSSQHSRSRTEVARQLTEGDIAKSELSELKKQLDDLNNQLIDARGNESALKATLSAKAEEHQAQLKLLEDAKKILKLEFEQAGRALLKQGETTLSIKNQESLDQLLKPLSEKIDGFQTRVNQVHSDLTGQNASLKTQIKQIDQWRYPGLAGRLEPSPVSRPLMSLCKTPICLFLPMLLEELTLKIELRL